MHQGMESGVTTYHKVEELEQYNVSKTDIQKLKQGGFHTIEAVAHATMRKLLEVKGLSEPKVAKLKELIKAQNLVVLGFQTASNRLECMKDMVKISTGREYFLIFVMLLAIYTHSNEGLNVP